MRMMKELKGNADFKVVHPDCPGGCRKNISIADMIEHLKESHTKRFMEWNLNLRNGH